MTKTMTRTATPTKSKSGFTILPLGRETHAVRGRTFVKTFCDDEPITKHLGIQYHEYEPFAMAVIQKAVKDGLSVVAVDDRHRVWACAIAEDITDLFKPNLTLYPKMKPIFAIIEELSTPFLKNKTYKKGKVAHTWIAMVAKEKQGTNLSTEIIDALMKHIAKKGYDFAYAEFTNKLCENVVRYYPVLKKINEIAYDDFSYKNKKPFLGVRGHTASYTWALKPDIKIDVLEQYLTK